MTPGLRAYPRLFEGSEEPLHAFPVSCARMHSSTGQAQPPCQCRHRPPPHPVDGERRRGAEEVEQGLIGVLDSPEPSEQERFRRVGVAAVGNGRRHVQVIVWLLVVEDGVAAVGSRR